MSKCAQKCLAQRTGVRRGGATILLFFVWAYRLLLSPVLHWALIGGCRFSPTCSQYAAESIRMHGACRGSLLALKRLCRCHPFHPGGYDPPARS